MDEGVHAGRAGRSQDKELQKLRRRVTKNTMPDNRWDPIVDVLLNWEPMEYTPHVVCDMAKPRHTTNHASRRPQNTVQRPAIKLEGVHSREKSNDLID